MSILHVLGHERWARAPPRFNYIIQIARYQHLFRIPLNSGVERFVYVSTVENNLPDFVLKGYFRGKQRAEAAVLERCVFVSLSLPVRLVIVAKAACDAVA